MKKLFLSMVTIGASLLLSDTAMAQRTCGMMEYHEQHVLEYPQAAEHLEAIEEFTQRFVERGGELTDRNAITIPVVVHVVYRTTTENISEAQILSQMNVLNADFRKLNSDASLIPSAFAGVAADAQIQFCLATVDPNGNPTSGIVRKSTTRTSFSTNNYVKYDAYGGSNAWPADRYLNVWVCNLSNGVLGYAQFPGGNAATDGVVCTYTAFGTTGTAAAPFNKGRTATHEVGHWLNLRHIWGDATCGTDYVNDTPVHNAANYGCPSYPHYSTCSGTPLEMTMNYMDYTDDACMYMFSAGQSSRMNALFAPGGFRYSLLSSNGCGGSSGGGDPEPVACAVPSGLSTGSITSSSAVISWGAVSGAASYDVQYRVAGGTWAQGNVTGTSANFTGLTAGTTYEWAVRANCSGGSSAFSATTSFTTTAASTCTNDSYEPNETFGAAKTLSVNTTYSAMKICPNDVDWFKFSSTSSQRKVRVRIYNLPADYDLELYSSNGTLLGTSANGGTANEGVYFNASGTGTYYVKVYGYNGASSNTAYTIRCERQKNNYTSAGRLDGESDELLSESFGFTAFPNPVTDNLTLQVAGGSSDLIFINMYDMSGRLVTSMTSPYSEDGVMVNIGTGDLRPGLYLIEAIAGEERITQRIVKD